MKKVFVKKLLTLASAVCITFTSAFAFAPQAAISVQAAGGITNPTPIQPNTDFSSGWTNIAHHSTQCYKVVLPSDGLFTVTLMQQNAFVMKGVIRKAQTLDSSSYVDYCNVSCDVEDSPRTGTVSAVLSAGTYYISVENDGGGIKYRSTKMPQYKLKTTYESFGFSETPDSYDSPKALALGATYTDAITKTDVEDWYRVTIPENKKYTIKCVAYQSIVRVKLSDLDLNGVGSLYCDRGTDTDSFYLPAGTYYILVEGSPSKYTLSMDVSNTEQPSVTKVKAIKHKKVDVTFNNVVGINGYQIRYSTNKNFTKNVKTKTFEINKSRFANGNKRVYTISKLKKNKKYYFQIRSYVDHNNVRYYSDWSKAKKVKVK